MSVPGGQCSCVWSRVGAGEIGAVRMAAPGGDDRKLCRTCLSLGRFQPAPFCRDKPPWDCSTFSSPSPSSESLDPRVVQEAPGRQALAGHAWNVSPRGTSGLSPSVHYRRTRSRPL